LNVALIIPVFNEQAVVKTLVSAIEGFRQDYPMVQNVILVDDGSTDGTLSELQVATTGLIGYHVIRFSRNFGHQMAITAGIKWCTSDAAIIMDADLQDPLATAGQMIEKWQEGFDVVYGVRSKRTNVPALQRLTAHWYYRLFRTVSKVEAPLDTGDFRLISRRVMDAYNKLPEQQPYVRGLIAWLGFKQIGIEYQRPGRIAGNTKYPYSRRLSLAINGLTSFSTKPLKLAVNLGFLVSFGSVLGLIWVLITKYVVGTAITGWASLIFAAFFFGGIQLFFLGIVGTYVARVYEEVKQRPRFIIQDIWHSESLDAGNVDPEANTGSM